MSNNVLQYTPWIDCNTGCRFCFNRNQPDVDKVKSLKYLISLLKLPEAQTVDGYGLIGGEFFQNQLQDPEVFTLFYELVDRIIGLLLKRDKHNFWITTSLLFKMDKYLLPFLDHIKEQGVLDRILLCTSWDSKYRFKNENARRLWEANVDRLHELYPELRIHVEIILTEHLMQMYLNGEFEVHAFADRYKVRVDFLEPNTGFQDKEPFMRDMPDFLGKRATFMRFVREVVSTWSAQEKDDFLNQKLRSNILYHIENGKHYHVVNRHNIPILKQTCKHDIKQGYSDSDRNMTDDYALLKGVI